MHRFPSSPARDVRGAAHRWRVLAAGVAANMSFSAAAAGVPTTAVWMRTAYHLDNGALGLVLGALGFGVALSELPWGMAADRFGDRRVLLAGAVATAAMFALMVCTIVPSAHGVPPLMRVVAAMCCVGLLGGSVNGSSGRAVMRWFGERERGAAMSIRQTAVPLGGGIGAALLPSLASHLGFAAVFGALMLLCAGSAALTWRWLHEPPAEPAVTHPATHRPVEQQPSARQGRNPLVSGPVWRIVLGIGLLCAAVRGAHVCDGVLARFRPARPRRHQCGDGHAAARRDGDARVERPSYRPARQPARVSARIGIRRGRLVRAARSRDGRPCARAARRDRRDSRLRRHLRVRVARCRVHGAATLAGANQAGTALGMANTIVYLGLFATPLAIPPLLAVSSWSVVWLAAALVAGATYPLFAAK